MNCKRFKKSLILLLSAAIPLAAYADREVTQLQFGKQTITVAEDETITFVDPKGSTDYTGQTSENAQSLTVFQSGKEGMSVQITFESMNMGGSGSYYSVANVYNGNPDADDSFTWATTTTGTGGVPTSYSTSVLPSGDILRAYPNEKGKTYTNETYFSTASDGSLSVGFAYRYAYSCTGWVAKVKLVKLENMSVKSAASSYDAVLESPKSTQNVTFAAVNITTEGTLNADKLTSVSFTLPTNETAINATALKLVDASGNDLNATITEASGVYTMTAESTLSEGVNTYYIKGDFLGTAAVGAKVKVVPTKVTTTSNATGIASFTQAEAKTVSVPAIVVMSSTPQTITVGDTPLNFYDEGGVDSQVCQNANGQVTFLPATSGKKVMVDFTKLNIWKGSLYVQEIRIYNGTEVKADNLLKTLNNDETGIVRSTSADGALTVQLFSNTTSTYSSYDGWEATVSQFTPQPMTVETLETAAASTATVSAGDIAEMLKIEICTENTEPALVPQSFSFTTNGTNALISKAAVYSTGTSAIFATTKKIGEADVTADNIVVNITDAKALVEGNNYFWLGYTVSSTAKNDQKVSAKLNSIAFTNSTTANYAGEVKAERTIKNIAIATEGTKTIMVDGSFGIQSEQYGANPTNYSAPGTTDRIVVFKPANDGYVCQVEFSDMEVYYSSSSYYGSKCKFIVYSGEGTSGTKLLEVTAPTSGSYYKTTGEVIRSTSADGALTIVYNPNTTSYYYCGKGFTGLVSEYLTQDQKVDDITVAQSSTAAVSAGGKKQAMLDLNFKMIGTANPIKLYQLNVNLKGTEASIEKVELYQGETLLGSANAATGDIAITLTEPASLNEGNNAFQLYVDVKADAEADATVDLKAVSAVIGGKTETIAAGDPEGSRVVKYMYLLSSGDNGTMSISDKTVMFYDDGGADNNSARKFTGNITFKPVSEGKAIKLTFKTLKLGAYDDKMNVSDGSAVKTTADKSYGYYDTSSPYGYDTTLPNAYVSKAEDGSLTVQWITGNSTTAVSNFAIEVSCYEKVPLAVTNITTTAGETTEVLKSSEGVVMQKIAVTVEGDKDNVSISNIKVNATETAALGAAKVYATGTANAFATTNLIGQSTTAGDIAVDYNITTAGTYYFWVTYDVPATVSVGDKASASVASVTANGNVISVAAPTTAQVAVISGKSGTYTVGAGGDYATIQSAINSLAIGVEGPVVLSIKPGTYNEKLIIPAIKGASSTNTITIKGAGEKRGNVKIYHNQYSSPAYGEAGYGVITFDNANYVTLQNLSVSTEDTNYEAVVYVRHASRHITIDGCYLSAPFTTNTQSDINIISHRVDNSKDADGNYLQNNNNDYLTIKNNVIEGGYIGINMGGTSYVALPKEVGGVIENNIVRGQGSKAIYVMDELGAKIKNNAVYNVEATASSFCGLDMQVRDVYTESTEVSGNTFYLANGNTATGMSFRQLTGTESAPVVIDHNEVRVVSKYAATTGVKFGNANISNVNFHHNSIRITQAETPVSTGGKALWISSAVTDSNFTVDSNIAQGETGDYAVNIYKDANATAITFKNNALYTNGTTFGYPSAVASYNEWKTLTGETDGINQNVAFKDNFRLFPAAEVGDRGAHPYDASQAAATKALGDPSADEEWGEPGAEPLTPVLTLAENESTVALGDSYDLYVTLEEGTAPYTLTITAGNTVVKTETLTETPEDILTYELTPTECTEYVVTVVDANEKSASDVIRLITTGDRVVATFENLPLESESSFSGIYELEDEKDVTRESTFVNGSYSFYQGTMPDYDSWWGIGYANHTGTSFSALADQFKNCVGGGYKESDNYAIAYYMSYMGPDCNPSVTVLNNEDGDVVPGMYVTNTAYALNSMQNGDSYAKKFAYGDWFKLTATGYDKDGNKTQSTDFYLADMRADNAEDRYIVTDWQYMDLSVLGTVKKIEFTMSSSDNSSYGMNTPAYFAFDNFGAEPSTFILADKSEYSATEDIEYEKVTYTRTFGTAKWQPLYVPFTSDHEAWSEDVDIAEITSESADGSALIVTILEEGSTVNANTPYLIKAKQTGDIAIEVENATLVAAENASLTCGNLTFTGTYSPIVIQPDTYYVLHSGSIVKTSNAAGYKLPSMRWYAESANGGEIKIRVAGTDIETTIADINSSDDSSSAIYNANGTRQQSLRKGVNIIRMTDGTVKKVIR